MPTLSSGLLVTGALLVASQATTAQTPPAGYMDYAALTQSVQEIAQGNAAACALSSIGKSIEGRDIHLLSLSSDVKTADQKPALLITAGIDGRHRVGSETAVRIARQLLANHGDLLANATVYIVPCVNPDGLQRNLGNLHFDHAGNMRPVNNDRDAATDEDGPQDLNGDGFITMMRRLDPPLDDKATHLPDPQAPRLLKTPNVEKGERAIYSLYVEGLDADGDGKIAEDGPGSVDINRNFMHRWPEHDRSAGVHQLSEPESHALADFVLKQKNIVQAITFGPHDNLINVPDGKGKDISGQGPKDLDPDDVNWYKELSKAFKEITGQERAASEDDAGSFHAWLYAQRGIPSFATIVWGRPEATKDKEQKKDEKKEGEANESTEVKEAQAISDIEGGDASAKPQPAEVKKEEEKTKPKKRDEDKPADAEAAAWLEYSDHDRNGEGFVEWQPFDHPTLGKVEIGGFVPGFRMNPPADQLDALGEKHANFIVELLKRQPKLAQQGPSVKKLATGVYEIRFCIVNEGYLPTTTAMARKARSILPTIVRISPPVEQIIAGQRVNRSWGIGGSGDRLSLRWIVRVNDGADLSIEIVNPQLGNQTITFKAAETP